LIKKGEPLTEIVCAGCGRTQRLRERKIVPCEGYTRGIAKCAKNPQFRLPRIPEGFVRHIIVNAAGAFKGYNTHLATPEDQAGLARARNILKSGLRMRKAK
jgi:hypothetical protein